MYILYLVTPLIVAVIPTPCGEALMVHCSRIIRVKPGQIVVQRHRKGKGGKRRRFTKETLERTEQGCVVKTSSGRSIETPKDEGPLIEPRVGMVAWYDSRTHAWGVTGQKWNQQAAGASPPKNKVSPPAPAPPTVRAEVGSPHRWEGAYRPHYIPQSGASIRIRA